MTTTISPSWSLTWLFLLPRAIYLNCAFKFGFWSSDTGSTQFYDPTNFTKLEITSQSRKPTICPPTWMAASVTCWHRSTSPPIVRRWRGSELHAARAVRAAAGCRYQRAESIHQRGDRRSDYPTVGLWVPLANRYIETTGISAKTSGDGRRRESLQRRSDQRTFQSAGCDHATVAKISYTKSTARLKSTTVVKRFPSTSSSWEPATEKDLAKALSPGDSQGQPGRQRDVRSGHRYVCHRMPSLAKMLTPSTETSPWRYEYLDPAAACRGDHPWFLGAAVRPVLVG